jgi:hypothetical protein
MRFNEGSPVEQRKARWSDRRSQDYLQENEEMLQLIVQAVQPRQKIQLFLTNQPVISLGCGSPMSTEEDKAVQPKKFEAWFPRLCWAYGAKPIIGIDVYAGDPADLDVYIHRRSNIVPLLIKPDALVEFLRDTPLIGKTAIVDARSVIEWGKDSSPTFRRYIDRDTDAKVLEIGLYEAASNILKDTGILLFNEDYSVLRDGKFYAVHTEHDGWLSKPKLIYPIAH